MTTPKEDELVYEIYEEGQRKYLEKLNELAALVDPCGDNEGWIKHSCEEIWKDLVKINDRHKKLLNRHGIEIGDNKNAEMHRYTAIIVKDSGCDIDGVDAYFSEIDNTWNILLFWGPEKPCFGEVLATNAVQHVKRELNRISLWIVIATRYKEIRKEVDALETKNSRKRIEKAQKQFEELKKL